MLPVKSDGSLQAFSNGSSDYCIVRKRSVQVSDFGQLPPFRRPWRHLAQSLPVKLGKNEPTYFLDMINRKYHICIWRFGGLLTALGVQAQTAAAQPDTLTSATVVDKEQSDVVTVENEQSITLSEAIALARIRSVDAAVALNQLKTAYWEYRTFGLTSCPR